MAEETVNKNGTLIQDEGPLLPENEKLKDYSFSYIVMDYDEEQGFMIKLNNELRENANAYDLRNSRGIVIGDYIYVIDSYYGVIRAAKDYGKERKVDFIRTQVFPGNVDGMRFYERNGFCEMMKTIECQSLD